MSRLELELHAAPLPPLHATFDVGLCAVLEPTAERAAQLIALGSGQAAPARDRALLDGRAPHADPAVRARIASLQAVETLPAGRTVLDAVMQVLAVRGDDGSAAALLAAAGLAGLAQRAPEQLSALETRSVALALALAHPAPTLLALHEPLATQISAARVCAGLARAAERSVVLATVSRFEDARALAGRIVMLGPQGLRELGGERSGARALRVRCADAEKLWQLLQDSAEILQVTRVGPRELVVHGESLEPLARVVAERAHAAALTLEGLREQVDPYVLAAATPARATTPPSDTPEHMRPIFGGQP